MYKLSINLLLINTTKEMVRYFIFFKIIFLIIAIYISACSKEESQIPYVPVNITLYVSDPQFVNLNAVTGWTYLTGGSRGILVYRRSNDEFMAYDRHCTYQPEDPCGVIEVEQSGSFTAIDSCCGSKFLITDGSVNAGPARQPLKQYQTDYDGTRLLIYN